MADDISDFYATEDMVKEIVKQYGRLDILINNAGIIKRQSDHADERSRF